MREANSYNTWLLHSIHFIITGYFKFKYILTHHVVQNSRAALRINCVYERQKVVNRYQLVT